MSIISKEDFTSLALFNNDVCVSIYIPTQRGGKDVLEGKNQRHLKSKWKEVKTRLEEKGVSKDKIENMAGPVLKLIDNSDFWRHQSDGFALFVSENVFEYYTFPLNFEEFEYIGKEFYLTPLVPMFNGKGRFYILEIQLKHVALYEATNYSIIKVDVDDITPSRLEERVGFDFEEKSLQFNSQGAGGGQTNMHGHAGADRERKDEIFRFFRAVDQGIDKIIHDETVPLVVSCEDSLFPIYKEANTFNHLYPESVPGNPADNKNMQELHAKAMKLIQPHLEKDRTEKTKQFRELSRDKTSVKVTDILPSIYEGKVDTLFLQEREDIFGKFDEENMAVEIQDNKTEDNTSLMNLAAKKVIEQGGSVFLVDTENMPEKTSKMNALFRYN
ncbi:hypothetical protein FK178_03765 [Antarcticibacterium arcticum]|uniref:Uncharacterized protein n=1 Tax=Antarcticibacterium arcticum TaxID=2585771 RepID=A0A5B8YH17_9FLAO|nr:hypothetical protein [Antarcticibacterium arcticum]QED36881.1 hypothetical protein FK178_03765 [Antarcticibacterium arcticum]